MKTRFLFTVLFSSLSFCTTTAQNVIQKGITYRYNGKNPRTPIGNVNIKAATSPNWVQSDSINGFFSIQLKNLQMGSYIGKVQVMKRGMMVFNQQAVDEWSVRKDPLNLILCDVNEFEKQKADLIAIGKREAQKKYEQQIAELEEKLKSSKIKEDDYFNQLAVIQEELDKARKYMDEYADVFARIDESEVDSTAQQAIELLYKGEIDKAIFLFEQKDYLKELEKNNKVISKSEQLIATAEQAKTKAEEDRDKNVQSIKAQINAYKIKNEWDKAGTLMKGLADLLNTFWANYEYAGFCFEQGKYADGEFYYKKTLRIGEDLVKEGKVEKNNSTYLMLKSSVQADLASLYLELHKYTECEELQLEVLNTFIYLTSITPENYESFLASIQYNLSILYSETNRYDEAERMLLSALEKRTALAKIAPETYEFEVSMTQNSLAKLYRKTRKFDKSEKLFVEVLQTRQRLAEKDSETYELNLSNTMHSLGELYHDMGRNEDSEKMYLNALSIRQKLFKKGNQTLRQPIADTQNNLALLYKDTEHYTESEQMFISALNVYRDLSSSYPQAYNKYVATIENNLGDLYHIIKEYEKSERMFLSAISIRQQLTSVNHDLYATDYAASIKNLAKLYSEQKKYGDSEKMHLKAIAIYQQLASKNQKMYELDLASAYYSLGTMKLSQEDNNGVVDYYQKAVDLFRRNSNLKSGEKDKYFVATLILWGHYTSMGDKVLSRSIGDELLPMLKEKYELDNKSYQQYYGGLLGNQSFAYIFRKEFHEAELLAREGIKVDSSQHFIYANLALSLLLQGKYEEAKNIYTEYKNELRDSFLDDIKQVEDAKIIPSKYQKGIIRIKELLSE